MVGNYNGLQCLVCYLAQPKKALGILDCSPEEKAKSAKTAMLFSRANIIIVPNVAFNGSSSKSILIKELFSSSFSKVL